MATHKGYRRIDESTSAASVASIVLTPDDDPTEVEEEATQQFSVVLKDLYGVAIPEADDAITWSVSDPDAGAIDDDGLFTAGTTDDTYQVTATHAPSGVSASVDVEVVAP